MQIARAQDTSAEDGLYCPLQIRHLDLDLKLTSCFHARTSSSRASLSDDWILACSSKTINRINGQVFLSAFSLQKGVFSFRINEWTRSWISLHCSPSAMCTRRLERDRLVSIRWLENLDHMALARAKWKRKNEATWRDPFNQKFRKFRSRTQWIGSVQPEKFRKNGSTFWGGLIFPVGPVGTLVEWIAPTVY